MSARTLPFHDSFFNIFENHKIEAWEAKEFMNIILSNRTTSIQRQRVYLGIRVLVECKYLTKCKNPRNPRTYLYSESEKIRSYRQRKNHEKLVQVLNEKRSSVHNQIISKNIETNFINELKIEHPHLALQMKEIQEKQLIELHELSVQKEVIKKLMDHFEVEVLKQAAS